MDCSPPDSSVHGILQARTLEWVAISFSRGIFPAQGSNMYLLGLLHWQADFLPLHHPGSQVETRDVAKLLAAHRTADRQRQRESSPKGQCVFKMKTSGTLPPTQLQSSGADSWPLRINGRLPQGRTSYCLYVNRQMKQRQSGLKNLRAATK